MLLILTDGEIHDMWETQKQIEQISNLDLPISIVIVGLGNEDFANMVKLDGDDVALGEGVRDYVQFIKYSEVVKRSEPNKIKENLAAVLILAGNKLNLPKQSDTNNFKVKSFKFTFF